MAASSPDREASESTPLLSSAAPATDGGSTAAPSASAPTINTKGFLNPFRRLVITCFLLSTAFFYTASIILVEFRVISCELYYESHPPYEGTGDRCSVREIESNAAAEISWMVTGTTISALLNLLWTGWVTRKLGVKLAMVMQTTIPALRNLCQQYAVYSGGWVGIRLLQWTQLITIFGGGAGYMLTANTYTAELVSAEERTGAFGVIQGVAMLGMSIAYTLGGVTADTFGPLSTFQVTFVLLIMSSFLSFFFLPYIPPPAPAAPTEDDSTPEEGKKSSGYFGFLAPLKVFIPSRIDETNQRYYGLLFLGVGIFSGVLATGYVPLMLQLHATNQYGFGASENGYLMSTTAIIRAVFLTLMFPKIIAWGRKLYGKKALPKEEVKHLGDRDDHVPAAQVPSTAATPQTLPVKATDEVHGSHFDLAFVRGSMVLDGVLTGLTGLLATKGWHMYVAAIVLPFASGTAPAGKGVVMELVGPDQRADALAAIALIETLAAVITVSLFGFLFSYLSQIGKPETVFVYNAAVALLAAAFLLLVRFPKRKPTEVV